MEANIPVRSEEGWRCPDCGGALIKGNQRIRDMARYHCEKCKARFRQYLRPKDQPWKRGH